MEIRKIDQRDSYSIRRLRNYAAKREREREREREERERKYCTVIVTKGKHFIKIKRKLHITTLNTTEILKKMYVCLEENLEKKEKIL